MTKAFFKALTKKEQGLICPVHLYRCFCLDFTTYEGIIIDFFKRTIYNVKKKRFKRGVAMHEIKIIYGLRDGKVVTILDIPLKERGLKCNCICPICHEKLSAKLGAKKQHHFSHVPNSFCEATYANQTALHILAKEIIEEEKVVKFPPIYVNFSDTNIYSNLSPSKRNEYEYEIGTTFLAVESKLVQFDYVSLENKISSVVPDIIAVKNDKECLIEIAVTHFVNDEKATKIKQLNLPMIEIDLSNFINSPITKNELKEIIINDIDRKKWIHNPRYINEIEKANEYFQKKILEIEKRNSSKEEFFQDYTDYNPIIQEELRKENNREKTRKLLYNALTPENYQTIISSLQNDESFMKVYETTLLKKWSPPPFFVNIPIFGEFIFDCDRRIWQTLLFEKFVFKRTAKSQTERTVFLDKVLSWIKKHQNTFNINWQYSRQVTMGFKVYNLLNHVVNTYFKYLDTLGFIIYYSHKPFSLAFNSMGYVKEPYTINPPNKENAKRLEDALSSVNEFSPTIDEDLNAFLT